MLTKPGINYQRPLILGSLLLGAALLINGCTVSHKTKKAGPAKDSSLEEVKPSRPKTKRKVKQNKKRRTRKSRTYEQSQYTEREKVSEEVITLPKRIPSDVEFTAILNMDNVYFDFDSFGLTGNSRASLAKQVDTLKDLASKSSNLMILIEGHCDERGTNEYNLALGEKRSAKVRNYLISLGVPSRIMYIKTWGEERPLDNDHSEEAWAKNRRVEFKISGADDPSA